MLGWNKPELHEAIMASIMAVTGSALTDDDVSCSTDAASALASTVEVILV